MTEQADRERQAKIDKADREHQVKIDKLLSHIRDWVSQDGGAKSELRLVKTWREHQWAIDVITIMPASTWYLGE